MTKILLVEDDKSLREIYGVRLLAEGYDIVSAGDGEEALAMAIKERPELIISDVMMPKISGFDMLDILRSTTETKDIKVIMMTALSSEDQRARGQALGADKYLVKSQVGIEDVVRTVHEIMHDAPVAAGLPRAATPPPANATRPSNPAMPARPTAPVYNPPASAPSPSPPPPPLPQPTAPFSTSRPASLGERVIHPISTAASTPSGTNPTDLASRIDQELQDASASPAPSPPAAPPDTALPSSIPAAPPPTASESSVPPAPAFSPKPVVPDGQAAGIDFEEIPRPPVPPSPPVAPPPAA